MQTSAPCHRLLQNIKEVIVHHWYEEIKIKFLGVLNITSGEYLYIIGDPTDCPECATEEEMIDLLKLLPNHLVGHEEDELVLEVVSCHEEIEGLTDHYLPENYMKTVMSYIGNFENTKEKLSA